MAQKGSRQNPYSSSEYSSICATSDWYGGWVEFGTTSSSSKYYITNMGEQISEMNGGVLGSEERPFAYSVFNEMRNIDIWTGGWVLPNPNNPSPRVTTYHTASNEIFGEINLIPLGEEDNPFLARVYNEMVVNEIWLGGWVLYDAGNKDYIGSMYGGGSGSGCGSGSGSGDNTGCGSGSGNNNGSGTGMVLPGFGYLNIVDEVNEKNYPITVSWKYGLAAPGGTSITATLDDENGPTPRAEWFKLYTMLVSCGSKSIEYSVPEIFRE